MPNFDLTISLPESVHLRNVAGEAINYPLANVAKHPQVVADMLVAGLKVLATNKFNSGGRDASESSRLGDLLKWIDAHERGTFNIVERASSMTALMREAYVAEVMAKHDNATEKTVTDTIRATVEAVFGTDEKATFPTFLKALAKQVAGKKGETRKADDIEAALIAKYEKAGAELQAERDKAGKVELDLTDIDI